jgi:hypothetical protein
MTMCMHFLLDILVIGSVAITAAFIMSRFLPT